MKRSFLAAALAFFAAVTASAAPPPAELILSTGKIAPTTTFEVRFLTPMVEAAMIGKPAEPSPVEIVPAVKGRFVWLSSRSGSFTPEEALPLSTKLTFNLRAELKDASGRLLEGAFGGTVETPPLTLKGWSPAQWFNAENAPADPRINLLFNADVSAADAEKSISFADDAGHTIAAHVVAADPAHHPEHAFPRYRSSDRSLLSWEAAFREHANAVSAERLPTATRANQLFVSATKPLAVGDGWKLVIAPGLIGADGSAKLTEAATVPIGTVKPFVVESVEAMNDGQKEGRRLVVTLSKPVAEEVKAENVTQWISVTPAPADMTAKVEGAMIRFDGDFQLETEYKVTVAAGLAAAQPFTLAEKFEDTANFEPIPASLVLEGFSTHQLSTGTRRFLMRGVNVPRVHVSARLFKPETLPLALTAYDEYLNPPKPKDDENYRKIDPEKIAGTNIYNRTIGGTEKVDTEREIALKWDEILGAGKTGVVLITAEEPSGEAGPRPGVQSIVQVTDLGIVWKSSKDETFAHVFSLATGDPLAGVKVRLVAPKKANLAEVVTDASGCVRLPANADARWIMAQRGSDQHLVPLDDYENRLSLYRFKIPHQDFDDEDESVDNGRQMLLFSERGVYRPGETVYLKSVIRDLRARQPRIPAGAKATVKAFDNRDREIFSREVAVSAMGSLDAQFALPKGTLGTYRAQVTLGTEGTGDFAAAYHEFEVQEYTPNAFEIAIQAPKTITGAVPIELPVAANYYMGKKLSQAQLSWSIRAEDHGFKVEGLDEFEFCEAIHDYRLRRALGRESHFADQGKLELSADGNANVATTLQLNPKAPQPRDATLLCEITDLNQQTVSKSAQFTLDSSDFYLGLHQMPEVVRAGDKIPISLVAMQADGKPAADPVAAKLRLTRIDWQNNRTVSDVESSEYQSEPIFKFVAEREVKTQTLIERDHKFVTSTDLDAGFTAGEAGLYLLEASATDAAGRAVLTSTTFYVSGDDPTEWNYRNEFQIDLVADKGEYISGETARILVKTPIAGDALVTVERDRVLRSFVTKLSGNAPSIEVPVSAADAPNVFVSVMLLRGANNSTRKFKEPDYRVGFCHLKVTRPEAKLAVRIVPERKTYEPSEIVNVTAEVRDIHGKPRAGAEVTLYAVDEGVLSLTGYETPDPLMFFNEPLPLQVTTSLTIPTLLREDPAEKNFENKGYMIGGGGDLSDAFRKNFITCAFWNGSLMTNADGRVSATFTAPDSLTRYRLIAVVQTSDDAYGSAESAFEVNKPVMLDPALPRFANLGDQLTLRGVLHNLTDVSGEAEVRLDLDYTSTTPEATQRVKLPAHGSVAVDFPVTFRAAGPAKWNWKASFTGDDGKTKFRDAVESTLKVGYPVAEMREVEIGRTEKPETDLLAKTNPALLEGKGVVNVSLGNTRVVELRESLERLLHYPYGCVEQTTSSTLPWIALSDFRSALPELAKTDEQIRFAVNRGVDRLISMQTSGGGLSYWPGGSQPHFWGSAYGGLGLAMAKRAGFSVPIENFDNLCKYVSGALRGAGETDNGWELSERCLAVYALAVAGKPEASYHEMLFKKQHLLTDESRALLALAVMESKGPPAMVDALLKPRRLAASEDDAFWNGARESAIRLLAWTHFKPEAPPVDALATELFSRRLDGHWTTTQGNAWALLALRNYLARVEKTVTAATGTLAWGGRHEPFALSRETRRQQFELPIGAEENPGALKLQNASKARIFTEVEVRSVPQTLSQPRQDQGYAIDRSYSKIEDDGTLSPIETARIGDRVLVTLRIESRRNARYVAVNDPLPAILEAVNPVFKTQATRAGETLGNDWAGDYQELRDDRALFFADYLSAGTYTIRYLARVRAAGTATAPSAKIEEMYHPERFGTTATMQLTSMPLK